MQTNFTDKILEFYNSLSEKKLSDRFFKHQNIVKLIEQHKKNGIFEISEIGKSLENREIFILKYGNGPLKILVWSQMHGDEPTATAALFDIFNYLENPNFTKEQNLISRKCTIFFIPMLNPDGAEVFKRRNAADIDINRDAVALQTPEGQLLMKIRDEIKPDFGFNLHDQEIYYSAGDSKFPAVLSFLAPAFDKKKTINTARENSMKLISAVNRMLQNYIPHRIGRYSDDYLPAAFGDAIQKRGTSTILIESGGFPDDPEKQFVRKMNVITILKIFKILSDNSYHNEQLSDYEIIPMNKKNKLFDFLIKNIQFEFCGQNICTDVGIRLKSEYVEKKNISAYKIEDIGDLNAFAAYIEIDGNKMKFDGKLSLGADAASLLQKFDF